ncbi:alpha-N-acetylglucosaminidase-like isoform X2 [Homalodisca vitripennis]|uniref:alpha-N-acetylglucosaminidase-like isoform X2 n=1 Tax=Homalodisca vitripennis TaxID=197043 RepID=UPI001EEA363D|nr:alpha-N-acetylglucosaminidase-like isoform X2 [Homalodisca vitripennis]
MAKQAGTMCTIMCQNYFIYFMVVLSASASELVFQESLSKIRTYSNASTQEEAVKGLIQRVIGDRASEFSIMVNPEIQREGADVFKIYKSENDSIVEIEGSSGVAAAWGFHHYLKYFCNCHISWDDNQLNLSSVLPPANVQKVAKDRFRYYQNVCTTSYSFVWWDWKQWERHIDWMALNGINLALAFNGQEAIWQRVYARLNMTTGEIDEHFTGPAFFAWGRMGNIRGWGGPLSVSWHDQSLALQKLILDRMRSLGIVPVLPAFAGHVPRAFKRLFPDTNLTLASKWNGFEDKYCCPYLLSPQEPLFKQIGSMFLEEMVSEFGTNHIYNCDTFNEMSPSSGDLDFLRSIGESIFQSLTQVDQDAVWMMQSWMFYHEKTFWTESRAEALLKSVPIGKMLVLDLMSELQPQFERLDSYFGQPFIWCMLHNFGGTLGMHGTAKRVNENVFRDRSAPNTSMVGIGLTMEGINQNYVMYDLMMEMGWREEPSDLSQWFRNYSTRRYGQDNIHLSNMWQLLKDSVYDYKFIVQQHGRYIVVRNPSLRLIPDVWYNASDVMKAWGQALLAVNSSPSLATTKTFRHDLVDLTRQALQLQIDFMYQQVVRAFLQKDAAYLSNSTNTFLEIMADMETILASNKWFLLGPWLQSAKLRASSPQEKKQFEYIARNQITLWGPTGQIRDYACKQWAYLMSNYYTPRWEFFFKELMSSVVNKTPFNQRNVSAAIFTEVEQPFTFGTDLYPTFEIGDSVEISTQLHKKWRHLADNYIYSN